MERLALFAAGLEPWPGPLRTPYEVDLGQVDLWLYIWAGILYGVVLAQNAIDGSPAATGREIPSQFSLWDAQLPEFWHGDDGQATPETAGGWPLSISFSHVCTGAGAA